MDPMKPGEAKKRIRRIIADGTVAFSSHAFDEIAKDEMTTVDCCNVLRGGVVETPEFERGSWRYRVRTNQMCVVVVFRSPEELKVITAWRIRS